MFPKIRRGIHMGRETTFLDGVTIFPRRGWGLLTDGQLLDFDSAFPHGVTQLHGAEISLNFSQKIPASKEPPRRLGELALGIYRGKAKDHLNEGDLPLADDDPLLGFVNFDSRRDATSYLFLSEWRWPSFPAALRLNRLNLFQPHFSLGVGGYRVKTQVDQSRSDPKTVDAWGALMTAAMQIRVIEARKGRWSASLDSSVRMLAGQAFGIIGEFGLRLTWAP